MKTESTVFRCRNGCWQRTARWSMGKCA